MWFPGFSAPPGADGYGAGRPAPRQCRSDRDNPNASARLPGGVRSHRPVRARRNKTEHLVICYANPGQLQVLAPLCLSPCCPP